MSPARAAEPCLDLPSLTALGRLVLRVEALRGGPCEVEWAYAAGKLWVLQARSLAVDQPRTSVLEAPPDPYGAWIARRLVWDLSPPPTPWELAVDWPALLAERLAPLGALGQRIPSPEEVFDLQDGLAIRLAPRWPSPRRRHARPMSEAGATPPAAWDDPLRAYLTPADLRRRGGESAEERQRRLLDAARSRQARYLPLARRSALLSPALLSNWLAAGERLQRVTASGGRVVGRARLVRVPADLTAVRPGEVVLAAAMRPTWAAILPEIAALVVEAGGTTSHAATLAREQGLPALLGALRAMSRVPSEALVLLDVDAGRLYWRECPPGRNGEG